jgi:hypothetical protein
MSFLRDGVSSGNTEGLYVYVYIYIYIYKHTHTLNVTHSTKCFTVTKGYNLQTGESCTNILSHYRYLDWAVSENSGIRKQDAARVFAAIASNSVGQPLAYSFLRNKWDRIHE